MKRKVDLLSIVVPCHNEQEVLPSTHKRLSGILAGLVASGKIKHYEVVYVDNGSVDRTLRVLKDIFKADKQVRIVSLRRNFGYQGSISAGLFHAEGDAVITIDADLQDPPEKIPEMIDHYEDDYDLVLGIREDRSSDTFMKKLSAGLYYRLLKRLGVEIVHNHGDFRLMDRSLVRGFNALPERNRFIRAMILQMESRYATVSYKRDKRSAGESKFNLRALFSLAFDGITSYTYFPLRLTSIVGVVIFLVTCVSSGWVVYMKFFTDKVIPGWASTVLPVLALGGIQLFFLGLIGEYVGKLYIEVKQRPLFLVRDELNHKPYNKKGEQELEDD